MKFPLGLQSMEKTGKTVGMVSILYSRYGFLLPVIVLVFFVLSCKNGFAGPPYGSTADTEFDIVRADDPTTFKCLGSVYRGARQIWDKRVNGEPVVNAFLFEALYSDGARIEIAINPEFENPEVARQQALRFAVPLGRLPSVLRVGIRRFSVHGGNRGFHAGTGQVVAYVDRATQRESYAHLEETLFHEAVHASLDDAHRLAPAWVAAQEADESFLTRYAQDSPQREDLAETALFAFAILHHPDRLPPIDTEQTLAATGHRVEYISDNIFPPGQPLTYKVGPVMDCPS